MSSNLAALVLPQLDELITKYEELRQRTNHAGFADIPTDEMSEFITAGMSAIYRIAGRDSQYASQLDRYIDHHVNYVTLTIPHLGGALKALRHAVASNYLTSIQELVHANVFADFLDMAEHLLEEGYKDLATIVIGGVLEEHLRKLCDKHGIALELLDARGASRPKKAEAMNADLAASNVYSKLDQKNVTAWLDLRNKAAHAQYAEYTPQQVGLLLQSVRDFLVRHPA